MKINMQDGLPIVTISMTYQGSKICLDNILLDTGCATTIFDTDEVEPIGLVIDRANGRPKRMYGVGGESELCYEQIVPNLHRLPKVSVYRARSGFVTSSPK